MGTGRVTMPVGADFSGLLPPVVVACSGGPDSLALLALAVEQRLAPVAVYVDHGLRRDSAADGEVVRAAAAALGARAVVRKVQVKRGGNLEERARWARYAALEAVRVELGATAVLVAHTADDQAETVLLNLVRGSGSRGLSGMPARRGSLARPLLGVRRQEARACCEGLGVTPVDDPTNADPAHRRNWVRHEVLPTLSDGARRDLVPVLTRQAAVLRAEADLLDELGDALLAEAGAPTPAARVLASAHPALARRAVRRWLGTPPPSLAEVERVLAVARGERRAAQLAGARRVWRQDGVMYQEVPCRP